MIKENKIKLIIYQILNLGHIDKLLLSFDWKNIYRLISMGKKYGKSTKYRRDDFVIEGNDKTFLK